MRFEQTSCGPTAVLHQRDVCQDMTTGLMIIKILIV